MNNNTEKLGPNHRQVHVTKIDPTANPLPNPLEVEACHWLTVAEIRCLPQLLASNLDFLDAWENGGSICRDTAG